MFDERSLVFDERSSHTRVFASYAEAGHFKMSQALDKHRMNVIALVMEHKMFVIQ